MKDVELMRCSSANLDRCLIDGVLDVQRDPQSTLPSPNILV